MKLLGRRIMLKKPVSTKKSALEYMSEKDQAELDADLIKGYNKLEVAEIGDEVTNVVKGDRVYVGKPLEYAEVVDVDGELFFIIADREVAIIW